MKSSRRAIVEEAEPLTYEVTRHTVDLALQGALLLVATHAAKKSPASSALNVVEAQAVEVCVGAGTSMSRTVRDELQVPDIELGRGQREEALVHGEGQRFQEGLVCEGQSMHRSQHALSPLTIGPGYGASEDGVVELAVFSKSRWWSIRIVIICTGSDGQAPLRVAAARQWDDCSAGRVQDL